MAGLWSDKIKASKGMDASAEKEKKTGIFELFEDDEDEVMTTPTDDEQKALWEERHFRICVALLGRTDLDSRNPKAVILRADKMVAALKEHYSAPTKEEKYDKIWIELHKAGYTNGDDVMMHHFQEACEDAGINPEGVSTADFGKTYDVKII